MSLCHCRYDSAQREFLKKYSTVFIFVSTILYYYLDRAERNVQDDILIYITKQQRQNVILESDFIRSIDLTILLYIYFDSRKKCAR